MITLFLSLLLITETISQSTKTPTIETAPAPSFHPIPFQTCCECTEKAEANTTWCEYDISCRSQICNNTADASYYAYCCKFTPDQRCLLRANAICYELPTVPLCCACTNSTAYAGCPKDIECQNQICADDPTCCMNANGWDSICANYALQICLANAPTSSPSSVTFAPTLYPTAEPTNKPTNKPTATPTNAPTLTQTLDPDLGNNTIAPTLATISPSLFPTQTPSMTPSLDPTTFEPTKAPIIGPTTYKPTATPTIDPTFYPSFTPSLTPFLNPTLSPSLNPTLSPTNNPSFTPSINPTFTPTESPSLNPSITPTINPSVSPSVFPTKGPSLNPTITPSHTPSEAPTTVGATAKPSADPSISPTREPTETPTVFPTLDPTQTPTIFPSFEPSKTPTIFPSFEPSETPTIVPIFGPTFYPTEIPTINPTKRITLEPTLAPTNISIAPGCIDCDKYLVELIDIKEQEEEVIATKECNYWEYKSKYSDSDSSNGFRRRKHRNRRHHHVRNKCTNHAHGWSESSSRRRLSSDCNTNNGYAERIRSRSWYNSIDSSDSDSDDDDDDMYEICITYAVKQYDAECGLLDSVFLSLCDKNDTNWANLTASEVDSIILSIDPDSLSANGEEIDGALGIMVHINAQDIDEFKLCLKNVSVTDNYLTNDFQGIDVSDWVKMNVDEEYKTCTNSDGLPCLNYVFSRKCSEECECNDGLIEIDTKYMSDTTASKIIFYYDLDEIETCIFETVLKDEAMKCSLAYTKYEQFEPETEFIIFYNNHTECKGVIDTNCDNDEIAVKYCDELKLIAWKDTDNNICIIPEDIELNVGNGNENALIDNDKLYQAFNIIAYELNSNWKTEIIIICSVLIGLLLIAIYYLFYSTKLVHKYNQERPVDAAEVQLTDYDNDDDIGVKYVDTEDDEYDDDVNEYLQTDS